MEAPDIGCGLSAWGKCSPDRQNFHHLAHHSADVAAALLILLDQPIIRRAADAALGRELDEVELRALTALAFLHDIGKLAPGFQAKGWVGQHNVPFRGHLECGWLWTRTLDAQSLAGAARHLARWSEIRIWLLVLFAHHGRPVPAPGSGLASPFYTPRDIAYDWKVEEERMGEALLAWFPDFAELLPPPASPRLVHFFCGLITLADWIGSDQRAFPFEPTFRPDYWATAQARAVQRIRDIGFSREGLSLRGSPGWALISDHAAPRPAQAAAGAMPLQERLVLLEAETGAGKTEAALWRFVSLVAAGEVDALYFAVPTRAAARQLQRRVNDALERMFVDPPEAVLAIPGQVKAGEASGARLPDFTMLWDDEKDLPARWAAEHAARFLASRVAVGAVDQVALGGLQVKYAHLRGTTLSRALLVIDEVHASDAYMTTIQTAMARDHISLGGHVMLMSATLGAVARAQWFEQPVGNYASEAAVPYPAIWTSRGVQPVEAEVGAGKTVHVRASAGWTGDDAARLATDMARQGARVLVIRNTVARAQETYAACRAQATDWLLQVNGIPTLHHGRFAAEDRARLDEAVEQAIGKGSPVGSRIVIGTQTLEQSLDLCADLLITDLCPMDVLLQRIGRLHRHRRPRPAGFEVARAVVLTPPDGLDGLTRRADNGLGAYSDGATLSGIYLDVPGLAATLDEIDARPVWHLPAMNRALVEAATHPEALEAVAERRGWQDYSQRVSGKRLGDRATARLGLLDRAQPLAEFPDDETLRTRLGEDGVVLRLPEDTPGAFGLPVSVLAIPARWSRGLTGEEEVVVEESGPPLRLKLADRVMIYGPAGLSRGGTDKG
nr:CRISPR-associated helicase Cas3' [Ancylobacter radicis]